MGNNPVRLVRTERYQLDCYSDEGCGRFFLHRLDLGDDEKTCEWMAAAEGLATKKALKKITLGMPNTDIDAILDELWKDGLPGKPPSFIRLATE